MKIYEKVVLDMRTMEVLEEQAYEHDGPVSLCKSSGGTSTSTSTIDKEYNDRMASIAESELEMGEGFYDFWMENNAAFEKAKIDANMELMPAQTDLEKAQIASQQQLLPAQTELGLSQISSQQQLLPSQTEAQLSGNTLTTAQNTASLGLLPAQTDAQKSTYDLTSARNTAALGLVPAQTEVANKFYDQALTGVNVEDRMGKASATMANQYKDASGILRRQTGRMGSNPSSGRLVSAMNSMNLDRAKATGLAKEAARSSAEMENFNRLQGAVGFGLPGA